MDVRILGSDLVTAFSLVVVILATLIITIWAKKSTDKSIKKQTEDIAKMFEGIKASGGVIKKEILEGYRNLSSSFTIRRPSRKKKTKK